MYIKPPRGIRIACTQTLEFADFNALADCTVMLVKRHIPCPQSRLYRLENVYRLLIRSHTGRDWSFCNEFCVRQDRSAATAAHTEEYGELLVSDHAVRRIGKAFMKDFSREQPVLPFDRKTDNCPPPERSRPPLRQEGRFRH